jgi:outer membrane protein assembly factor BamD
VTRRLVGLLLVGFIAVAFAGCSKKTAVEKSPQQLINEGVNSYREGDYSDAADAFSRLKQRFPYSRFSLLAEIRLADAQYRAGNYKDAAYAYADFIRMHPRNQAVPYALYQLGMCWYNRISTPDRDQSSTRKAARAFGRLMKAFPKSIFAARAKAKLDMCLFNLAAHEYRIGNYYFVRGHYKAALARFIYLLKHYPDTGQYHNTLVLIKKSQAALAKKSSRRRPRRKTTSPPLKPAAPTQTRTGS